MLSVVLAIRNNRQQAQNCLLSFPRTFRQLGLPPGGLECIVVDDASATSQQIPAMLQQFRQQIAPAAVTIQQFVQHQHYTRALAYAFSVARGSDVLFVSHDMILTAEYVRTILEVAKLDTSIGLVRGVSPSVDCFPQHCVRPDIPIRSFEDMDRFAASVRGREGLRYVEDDLLTGDSMLIKRAVFDKIGVFDPRFFGYFGDIDFGLRAQRAGFKLVCAKGAWLLHAAAGAYKDQAQRSGDDMQAIHTARMRVVNEAYKLFREKWDPTLPTEYRGFEAIDFGKLRHGPAPAGGDFVAPITPDPAICRVI